MAIFYNGLLTTGINFMQVKRIVFALNDHPITAIFLWLYLRMALSENPSSTGIINLTISNSTMKHNLQTIVIFVTILSIVWSCKKSSENHVTPTGDAKTTLLTKATWHKTAGSSQTMEYTCLIWILK